MLKKQRIMQRKMLMSLLDYIKFYRSLKEEKLINIYENFEKPMLKILASMEMEGIKIDNKFLKALSSKFKKDRKIQKEVFKISKKNLILHHQSN